MILFLAGTSDARALALKMEESGFRLLTTVVTESGAEAMKQAGLDVRLGRLTAEEIGGVIDQIGAQAVVDASHPFAEEASKNAMKGAFIAGVPYIRYERESQTYDDQTVIPVSGYEEAAELAAKKRGVILLTTGCKTMEIFTDKILGLSDTRLIARMLPRKDNLEKCEKLGFPQKNIVAIQGPFTKEFNKALFQQYGVTVMVTKESGEEGSVDEKIEAAIELGIETILIKRPKVDYGTVISRFEDMMDHLQKLLKGGFADGL